jgi:hypothetical protein
MEGEGAHIDMIVTVRYRDENAALLSRGLGMLHVEIDGYQEIGCLPKMAAECFLLRKNEGE